MTFREWFIEAEMHMRQTPKGRIMLNAAEWLADAELSDEEWWAKHGGS